MKLPHLHKLVSIHARLTAFNGDGEDGVRARAVFIHVCGANRPWFKKKKKRKKYMNEVAKSSLIERTGSSAHGFSGPEP